MKFLIVVHREQIDETVDEVCEINRNLFDEYRDWIDVPAESIPTSVEERMQKQMDQILIPLVLDEERSIDDAFKIVARYVAYKLKLLNIHPRYLNSIRFTPTGIELVLEIPYDRF